MAAFDMLLSPVGSLLFNVGLDFLGERNRQATTALNIANQQAGLSMLEGTGALAHDLYSGVGANLYVPYSSALGSDWNLAPAQPGYVATTGAPPTVGGYSAPPATVNIMDVWDKIGRAGPLQSLKWILNPMSFYRDTGLLSAMAPQSAQQRSGVPQARQGQGAQQQAGPKSDKNRANPKRGILAPNPKGGYVVKADDDDGAIAKKWSRLAKDLLAETEHFGEAARQNIKEAFDNAYQRGYESLKRRGLTSSTITQSLRLATERERERANRQIDEALESIRRGIKQSTGTSSINQQFATFMDFANKLYNLGMTDAAQQVQANVQNAAARMGLQFNYDPTFLNTIGQGVSEVARTKAIEEAVKSSQPNAFESMIPGLGSAAGMGVGALVGGPTGALVGAGLGGTFGSAGAAAVGVPGAGDAMSNYLALSMYPYMMGLTPAGASGAGYMAPPPGMAGDIWSGRYLSMLPFG